jgi:hypothetical protein
LVLVDWLQQAKEANLTASYAEEKGDIYERRRPCEDLVMNGYYYIKRRKKNVPKRGKLRHKGCIEFMRLRQEGAL